MHTIGNTGTCLRRDRCGMMGAAVRQWRYTRRVGLRRRCVAFDLVGHAGGDRFYVCATEAHSRSDCEDVVLRCSGAFTLCRQCSHLPVGIALRPGPGEPQLQPVLPQPQPLQPQDQPDPPQAIPLQPHVQHVQLPEPCVEVSGDAVLSPGDLEVGQSWHLVEDSHGASGASSSSAPRQGGSASREPAPSAVSRVSDAGPVVLGSSQSP